MRITESQLRKIIAEEISSLVEAETAGEKAAAAASKATSVTGFDTAAAKVKDKEGVADLLMDIIVGSPTYQTNKSNIKSALKAIYDKFDDYAAEAEKRKQSEK